ncbi:MAG: hypothetical protein U1A73_27455, partial [Pseudomonas sp.]|nr:hypothetical protein [Pseudomonas sp.]
KGSQHLHRINRILGARFRSNIGYAFRQAVPADQIDDAVDGLVALIDGRADAFDLSKGYAAKMTA